MGSAPNVGGGVVGSMCEEGLWGQCVRRGCGVSPNVGGGVVGSMCEEGLWGQPPMCEEGL